MLCYRQNLRSIGPCKDVVETPGAHLRFLFPGHSRFVRLLGGSYVVSAGDELMDRYMRLDDIHM